LLSEQALDKLSARGRSARRQRDLELWEQWKQKGEKPDELRPLLGSFRGMIRSYSNKYAGNVELPPAAVHAEFTRQAVNAFRTYNPDKGTALGSWVGTNLQKGRRFVATYQNTARIGEHRIYKIGQFQNAVASLDDQLGREPTTEEISEVLAWSPKEVTRMGSEIRKSRIDSAFEGDPTSIMPSREAEVLKYVRHQLSPEEKLVYEYTIGEGGKPQLRPGQIAQKLKMSPAKVTRLRDSIYRKMQSFM
jgi:DNA-directed RNA polymerase specialized sigma subunit